MILLARENCRRSQPKGEMQAAGKPEDVCSAHAAVVLLLSTALTLPLVSLFTGKSFS